MSLALRVHEAARRDDGQPYRPRSLTQLLSGIQHFINSKFLFVETVANGTSLTDADTQLTPIVGKEQRVQESIYSKIESM